MRDHRRLFTRPRRRFDARHDRFIDWGQLTRLEYDHIRNLCANQCACERRVDTMIAAWRSVWPEERVRQGRQAFGYPR